MYNSRLNSEQACAPWAKSKPANHNAELCDVNACFCFGKVLGGLPQICTALLDSVIGTSTYTLPGASYSACLPTVTHCWSKMPPALHPRSRQTGALFTSTLAICFLVVGAPHILPCPVNPKQFADTIITEGPDGQPVKRRRRRKQATDDAVSDSESAELMAEDAVVDRRKRECPVPKPGGLVGQVMGFKEQEREKPSQVIVKELQSRKSRSKQVEDDDTP